MFIKYLHVMYLCVVCDVHVKSECGIEKNQRYFEISVHILEGGHSPNRKKFLGREVGQRAKAHYTVSIYVKLCLL